MCQFNAARVIVNGSLVYKVTVVLSVFDFPAFCLQ